MLRSIRVAASVLRTVVANKEPLQALWLRRRLATEAAAARRAVNVFFGSQTGTAMGFAQQLARMTQKRDFPTRVIDLASFEPQMLHEASGSPPAPPPPEIVNVFVTATFGKGEPTSNAVSFHRWLTSEATSAQVGGALYAVFGLGQSKAYPERYQAMGKAVERHMNQLGASAIIERGEGDDADDIEVDFDTWAERLMARLDSEAPLRTQAAAAAAAATTATPPSPPTPSEASASGSSPSAECVVTRRVAQQRELERDVVDVRNPLPALVLLNQQLHSPQSPGSCKLIQFDLATASLERPISYETGDYLGVLPNNPFDDVEQLARDLRIDMHYVVQQSRHSAVLRRNCTMREALLQYYDVMSVPRRSHLRLLALHASSAADRERLERLATSPEDYQRVVAAQHLSMIDLMHLFPSLGFEYEPDALLEALPPLMPRFYSIASSATLSPEVADLLVSVVRFQTPNGRLHHGVCSNFLDRLRPGDRAPIFVKRSLFRLPPDPRTPIIMIGCGTGLAPFRAFIAERAHLRRSASSDAVAREHGRNLLFLGCRRRQYDFLCRDELERHVAAGHLDLVTAFAFDQPDTIFVQHRMLEPNNSALIWSLLDKQRANVYVCGNVAMGRGVFDALVEIVASQGAMSREAATQYVMQLQEGDSCGRYQTDVFS